MNGSKRGGLVLQERDRLLLSELGTMRVIDRELAEVVGKFGSITRANVRLLKLVQAGLLRKFFVWPKAFYGLSETGARLAGVPARGPKARGQSLALDSFLAHQLAVNRIHCAFKYRAAPMPDVGFSRWVGFQESIASTLQLIPDGYVEMSTPSGALAMFVEVDLGNESLAVWRRKASNYLQLALTGECERRFGQQRFRVLVLADSERRLQSIRSAIAEITDKLFWFTTLESVNQEGLYARVWLRPKVEDEQVLIQSQ